MQIEVFIFLFFFIMCSLAQLHLIRQPHMKLHMHIYLKKP